MYFCSNKIFITALIVFQICFNQTGKAWNARGHKTVVQIAKSMLDAKTIKLVDYYLDGTTWEDAACWLDENSKEKHQQKMNSWQYVLLDKNSNYVETREDNLVNKLEDCLHILEHKKKYSKKKIQETVKILFHLMAEIHNPMHCGYSSDNAGRKSACIYSGKAYSLNQIWENEIIETKKIDVWSCTKYLLNSSFSLKFKTDKEAVNVNYWYNDTRKILDNVYEFKNLKIDENYLENNASLTQKQLIKAGLRLANVLRLNFKWY